MAFAARNEVCNKISLRDTRITATSLLASSGPLLDFDVSRQLFLSLNGFGGFPEEKESVLFSLSAQCVSLNVQLRHFIV